MTLTCHIDLEISYSQRHANMDSQTTCMSAQIFCVTLAICGHVQLYDIHRRAKSWSVWEKTKAICYYLIKMYVFQLCFVSFDLDTRPWPWHFTSGIVQLYEKHRHTQYEVSKCEVWRTSRTAISNCYNMLFLTILVTFDLDTWPWH